MAWVETEGTPVFRSLSQWLNFKFLDSSVMNFLIRNIEPSFEHNFWVVLAVATMFGFWLDLNPDDAFIGIVIRETLRRDVN